MKDRESMLEDKRKREEEKEEEKKGRKENACIFFAQGFF